MWQTIFIIYGAGWLLTAVVMVKVGRGRGRVFYALLCAAIWPLLCLGFAVIWFDSRFTRLNRKRWE